MATLTVGALTVRCQACQARHDVQVTLQPVGHRAFAAVVEPHVEQQLRDWARSHHGPFTHGT